MGECNNHYSEREGPVSSPRPEASPYTSVAWSWKKKHNQALQHRSLKDISRGAFAPGLCQIINDLAKVFCSLLVNFGGQHSGETNTPNSWLCRPLNARHEEDLQPVRVPRRHPGFCTNSAAAINIYIYVCYQFILYFLNLYYIQYI